MARVEGNVSEIQAQVSKLCLDLETARREIATFQPAFDKHSTVQAQFCRAAATLRSRLDAVEVDLKGLHAVLVGVGEANSLLHRAGCPSDPASPPLRTLAARLGSRSPDPDSDSGDDSDTTSCSARPVDPKATASVASSPAPPSPLGGGTDHGQSTPSATRWLSTRASVVRARLQLSRRLGLLLRLHRTPERMGRRQQQTAKSAAASCLAHCEFFVHERWPGRPCWRGLSNKMK